MTIQSTTVPAGSAGAPPLADFRFDYRASLISPIVVQGMVRAADFALVAVLGASIYEFYVKEFDLAVDAPYLMTSAGVGIAATVLFATTGLYSIPSLRSPVAQLSRLALSWTSLFAMLVAAVFLLKAGTSVSRVWLVAWYLTGAVSVVSMRTFVSGLVRGWMKEGRLVRRAIVVGGGGDGETLLKRLEAEDNDIRICGVFDDRAEGRVGNLIAGYPKLGSVAEIAEFARRTRVDLILVALPTRAESRLLEVLRKVMELPVDIRLSSLAAKLRLSPTAYSYIGAIPFLDVASRPIANWAVVQKFLFDRIIASLALVALSPVMLATAWAIKRDSKGPVLFKQKRYGFNNELIEVYKFRSMYTDLADQNASKLVTRGDPRVTKVGRFIRKTSLDELPQLFNVLKGELSLVGPRPHALQAKAADKLYQDAVDGYFARHRVKPGLTGWAQINGWRGETDTEEKIRKRVECDLYYIDHWSVALDLYILLKTPFALLKSENAY